jgi:hypothetical protein
MSHKSNLPCRVKKEREGGRRGRGKRAKMIVATRLEKINSKIVERFNSQRLIDHQLQGRCAHAAGSEAKEYHSMSLQMQM